MSDPDGRQAAPTPAPDAALPDGAPSSPVDGAATGSLQASPAPGSGPTPAPPSRPWSAWLDALPWWLVPAMLVGVPLLVTLAARLSPSFYDHVVWQDYWGPIKADAEGRATLDYHGVVAHSGYNVVNTASWAVLLAVCLLGIAQLLRWTRTPMDGKLIVGATGWVVAGSIFHVMEDTGLLRAPLQYVFITPPIYLLFAAGGVLSLVLGHYLRGVQERAGLDRALAKLWFILCVPVLLYLAAWLKGWDQVTHYVNPFWAALFALVAYAACVVRFRRLGRLEPADLVGLLSIGWILFGAAYVWSFISDPWPNLNGLPFTSGNAIPAALWAPVLAAAVTAAMFVLALLLVGRAERKGKAASRDFWFAFFSPINLLILFAQMLDGFATAIGIDAGGYSEKHVLSSALIEMARNAGTTYHIAFLQQHPTLVGFTTVKFAISLLVIGAIDGGREQRERAQDGPLIGLVKFAIIMVGIGPGIRDFLRMSLGV